jgi:hypothetical protein
LGKACGRNPDVYAAEKSDTGVVPKKEPSQIGWPMAEALEGRPVTRGNSEETAANCTQEQGGSILVRRRQAPSRLRVLNGHGMFTSG